MTKNPKIVCWCNIPSAVLADEKGGRLQVVWLMEEDFAFELLLGDKIVERLWKEGFKYSGEAAECPTSGVRGGELM